MLRYRRIVAASIVRQFETILFKPVLGPRVLKSDTICTPGAYYSWNNRRYVTKRDQQVVTYEEVAQSVNKPNKIIVDVRNNDEIKSTGQIPSSINIPLQHIQEVLGSMSAADFEKKFHRPKPTQSDELIFYCKSGRRATEATNTALKLGYSKSKKFLPGWEGWVNGKK